MATSNANSNAEADYDKLKEDLSAVRADLASLTESLSAMAKAQGHEGVEALQGAAKQAQAQARNTADSVGQHIAERPLSSVLVAFGVGLLLGRLLNRQ